MLQGKFSVEVRHDEISEKIGLQLKDFLLSSKMIEDKENPDYVFAIGGDGTVLRTFNKYMDIYKLEIPGFDWLCGKFIEQLLSLFGS